MEKYNYYESVKDDVTNNLEEWFDYNDIKCYSDIDEIVNEVQDDFFNKDSVTGNASGSYTFNAWEAEENLCHNMELLSEALSDFGGDMGEYVERGAETCDVTIRCYVLGQVVRDAVVEYIEEHYPNFGEFFDEDDEE